MHVDKVCHIIASFITVPILYHCQHRPAGCILYQILYLAKNKKYINETNVYTSEVIFTNRHSERSVK